MVIAVSSLHQFACQNDKYANILSAAHYLDALIAICFEILENCLELLGKSLEITWKSIVRKAGLYQVKYLCILSF